MIAVDTNVLARFYCEDPDDPEAARQRPTARRLLIDSPAVFVPLTVVLELEWVMRGFYEVGRDAFCEVIDHLLGMRHVTVEQWEKVKDAIDMHRSGLDFADALHLASCRGCEAIASFDKRFARSAARAAARPPVTFPV